MHPQSELENYKLQVELLQEKLHRSEDNRQELEGKLEQIMKKRNEHERTLRSRSQRKYQQFLDEQKKRNERNRKLVEMLERIDQQAAALSARSERLKMMKLQYELYFFKLVQSYSMKTLQNIPTGSILPIQKPSNAYPSIKNDNVKLSEVLQTPFNNNTASFQTVPIPVVVPISNEQNRFHRSWAFASAPPGVLITLANNSTLPSMEISDNKKNESNFTFDYSQFPIGYLQTPAATAPLQCHVGQSYFQQPLQQEMSTDRHSKPLFTPNESTKPMGPYFEFRHSTPSPFSFGDDQTNETVYTRTQSNQDKPQKSDDSEINKNRRNEPELEHFTMFRMTEMSENDLAEPHQSLKIDKSPTVNSNNSFQRRTEDGRTVHRGNKPNTIDFRTDNDNDDAEYIKYIKEMKETYERNVPIPINVTPQEQSIDNITTTLQIQKIDETNVKDDEKINDDVEDNEKNTSSAFPPPLGGKCSIESIGDEAPMKKPLGTKTEESTSNTAPARNIDPSRDTEQITLFNGTKNSKDESTGASNRTAAIIDDGGKNTENTEKNIESTRLETSYRPMHFNKKEKMSIENIETAIYGELLPKPENLASVTLQDKSNSNEQMEEAPQETVEQYTFKNSGKEEDKYQGEQTPGTEEEEQQVQSYETDNEHRDIKNEEVIESIPESFNYDTSAGIQEYDMQNYNYPDAVQQYTEEEAASEQVPQQEYQFPEDEQQPQIDNYSTDYQNYDASQYQSEYDPNAYQYDYEQQQYEDPNQPQYPPEMYNQEYQQDPYSGEYANYEQDAVNEIDQPQQVQYEPEEQQPPAEEQPANFEQAYTDTDTNNSNKDSSNVEETNEELVTQKVTTPTSILSTEKHTDLATKKKKRVNFVDSETDESSAPTKPEVVSSESDFDFSAN